ncbi:MAG: hypothetical protein LBD16_01555 [Oscillospiraceae bacterium]|nr:hypothetical protein [Oscillospiraceae bacterium]
MANKLAKPQPITKTALLLFAYGLLVAFVSLLLAPILVSDNTLLRAVLNSALIIGCAGVFFGLGASRGFADCSTDATREKHGQARLFFNVTRILIAAVIAAVPWILIGIYTAITAKPYTYQLQDLPPWLYAYTLIPQVGAPLELYNTQAVASVGDYLKVAQRFVLLPFVNLFTMGGDAASYLFDRISFLPAPVLPLSYFVGYLTGPSRFKKEKDYIETVKKKPKLRLKQEAKKRVPQKREPNRLI